MLKIFSIIKTHERNTVGEHIGLTVFINTLVSASRRHNIPFCLFERPSVGYVRSSVTNLWMQYFENEWTDFNAHWHKSIICKPRSWSEILYLFNKINITFAVLDEIFVMMMQKIQHDRIIYRQLVGTHRLDTWCSKVHTKLWRHQSDTHYIWSLTHSMNLIHLHFVFCNALLHFGSRPHHSWWWLGQGSRNWDAAGPGPI